MRDQGSTVLATYVVALASSYWLELLSRGPLVRNLPSHACVVIRVPIRPVSRAVFGGRTCMRSLVVPHCLAYGSPIRFCAVSTVLVLVSETPAFRLSSSTLAACSWRARSPSARACFPASGSVAVTRRARRARQFRPASRDMPPAVSAAACRTSSELVSRARIGALIQCRVLC